MGYFPVSAQPYDREYWDSYRERDQTPMGEQLTQARCDLVARHWNGNVVDIGIGGGRFVGTRHNTFGFDINPSAVDWLERSGRWWNPYNHSLDAATFWDSLEHIQNPARMLANIRRWVFVSVPIFRDLAHLMVSKHRKYDEHCWYFEERGLLRFMALYGWMCVEANDEETRIGREDIRSYAFLRR